MTFLSLLFLRVFVVDRSDTCAKFRVLRRKSIQTTTDITVLLLHRHNQSLKLFNSHLPELVPGVRLRTVLLWLAFSDILDRDDTVTSTS